MFTIAVFKSRRDAIQYAAVLSRYGVNVTVVGTPRKIGVPCGLSVRFSRRAMPVAERALHAGDFYSFNGFYMI